MAQNIGAYLFWILFIIGAGFLLANKEIPSGNKAAAIFYIGMVCLLGSLMLLITKIK